MVAADWEMVSLKDNPVLRLSKIPGIRVLFHKIFAIQDEPSDCFLENLEFLNDLFF